MIIGNEKQQKFLERLLRNLEQGTILVFGPEGVGKFSFLKKLLKDFSTENIVIDSEDKILKIETARMITNLGVKKTNKRIIIINDAHKFQLFSQNTLLKTLEEAPSKTIFILITHRFYKILPTIRSRSILVRFGLIPYEKTFKFLQEKGYQREEINMVINFYWGQPGKALKFLENKLKREIFQKFILSSMTEKLSLIEDIKNTFSLSEFLEYYLLFIRRKMLQDKKIFLKLAVFYNLLNLYQDSLDYNLNLDIQLINLILNNG